MVGVCWMSGYLIGFSLDEIGSGTLGRALLKTVQVSVASDFIPFAESGKMHVYICYIYMYMYVVDYRFL